MQSFITIHNWKYLRVCGEESTAAAVNSWPKEIPPRVRRRDNKGEIVPFRFGNTSACAEKSIPQP